MADGKLGDEKQELPEHKVVHAKNRGGLLKFTAEIFKIFCIAEQIFEKKKRQKHVLIKYGQLEETRKLANFLKLKNENAECTKRGVAGGLSELIYFLEICLYLFFVFFNYYFIFLLVFTCILF